ncbi:hypothetical protein C0992_009017 [Termitomyces sp. T32_za158]|nr:hypothetical protein C0992_009017 [Termitomyces sp. T32_za158]
MPSSQTQEEHAVDVDDQPLILDLEEEQSSASDIASPSTSSGKKKKKKSKAAKALNALRGGEIPQQLIDRVLDEVKAEGSTASTQANQENVREALERLKIMDVVKGKAGIGGTNKKDIGSPHSSGERSRHNSGEGPPIDDGYIEPSKPQEEVRQDAYPLPDNFEWSILDLSDPQQINYLCVHKKLRSKRLAPVMIKEVTRQVHLKGVFQAIYTAGVVVPTPVSVCRYYHRLLNVQKLIDIKFAYVPRSMTLARMIRVNKVPSTFSLPGLREMVEGDVPQVADLFMRYMQRFDLAPLYSLDEVRHQFMSGMGTGILGDGGPGRRVGQVTWTYVVEDPETHRITDFFSFYSLPSTVINNAKFPVLEAAYLFYYATETAFAADAEENDSLKKRLEAVVGDALVVANKANFDVFNALTLMDNVPILPELKFGIGDGVLNFYLYNWRTAPLAGMNSEGGVPAGKGIGVVML